MKHQTILVTGGAGFIGSSVAVALKSRSSSRKVTALDSLRRRGSELNLPRLREAGVEFRHGDIRNPEDLKPPKEPYDLIIECSAEPSVSTGYDGDTRFIVNTNLAGTVNCLDLAKSCKADVLFLSTSRVYPIARLNGLAYRETATRFELTGEKQSPGASAIGISEDFPLSGSRSLYGATKLASELLVQEYSEMFGIKSVVTRLGVIAGPWQMGKVDQGVFSYWMLSHHFGRPLKYMGFNGLGKQARDLLHVNDLVALLEIQMERIGEFNGCIFNAGGGREVSLSLVETTALCQKITGKKILVDSTPMIREGDIRVYITDNSLITKMTGWKPTRSSEQILNDIHRWIAQNEQSLARLE